MQDSIPQKCSTAFHFFVVVCFKSFIKYIHLRHTLMGIFRILFPCHTKPFLMQQYNSAPHFPLGIFPCKYSFLQDLFHFFFQEIQDV